MGANAFYTISKAVTPYEAFSAAVKDAQFNWGHDGHTGTIAEKHGFTLTWDYKDDQPHALASFVGDTGEPFIYAMHAASDLRTITLDDFKNSYDAGDERWHESGLPWERKGYKCLAALLSIVTAQTVEQWHKVFWSKSEDALCVPLANDSFLFCGYASS